MRDGVLNLGGERGQVPDAGAGEEAGGGDDVQGVLGERRTLAIALGAQRGQLRPGREQTASRRPAAVRHQSLRLSGRRSSWPLVGILHGCLKTGTPYDEATAWSHRAHALAA
ncbi:hypothetical protein F7Q99_27865 [Streptomyces kaniharaensis]|uniref:IS110 family transposase n=1 Tax=Streptomyces kaniharaensis TaxID=212423 RepID=A0A6N7KWD6_9ACTN|nr:hypothetical protein [Streptomyces kaniharaensis]MQS15966.1 hypothetical protein [Streptomyces kaniharaensis]